MAKLFKKKEVKPEPSYLSGKKKPEEPKVLTPRQKKLEMFRNERK